MGDKHHNLTLSSMRKSYIIPVMPKSLFTTFIYTALPCEAKPLITHFGLKKQLSISVFAVYCNNEICLTVAGVGKSAMAAAIAYTQALFALNAPSVFVNVGIAGHCYHAVGELFLIDKIYDGDSGKNHYPPLVFKTDLHTASLQTVSKPLHNYHDSFICDMEASAFYETAARFSTGELIQCLKVISDNALSPVSNITPQQVSELIAAQLPAIENLLAELKRLAQLITTSDPMLWLDLTQRYHFTASERMQLKNQLSRWEVLTNGQPLDVTALPQDNGKAILRWLAQIIANISYSL
jgi:adenosylhomocysteine nucleosidase